MTFEMHWQFDCFSSRVNLITISSRELVKDGSSRREHVEYTLFVSRCCSLRSLVSNLTKPWPCMQRKKSYFKKNMLRSCFFKGKNGLGVFSTFFVVFPIQNKTSLQRRAYLSSSVGSEILFHVPTSDFNGNKGKYYT